MYKLVIADDEGKTTVVPLVRDEITIGRKEGNTIRLTERNISRRHAKLRKANGSYLVEDLSSYNGVKVNGRRIGNEATLKAGDQISIGDYQLALQLDDGATIPDTTAPMAAPNGGAEPATAMLQSPAIAPGAPTLPAGGVGTPAIVVGPPARLVMTSQPAPGAEFALARPVTRIGRAEELDVWINHRSISREHAEVTNDGGAIRIKDLGSANGVRVNGRDVQQAELKPGDTLELGQVRFRFVGPGEQFVFDAAHTMQLEAASPERPTSRAPIFVAAGIVGLAVVGAVVVAISGGQPTSTTATPITEPPVPSPTVPTVHGDPTTAVAGPSVEERVAAAVAACVTARNGGHFDLALQRAGEALAILPSDVRALDCQAGAQQDREESDAFARGVALRNQGNLEGAYLEFDALPPQSPFRTRPEVEQTMRDFADATLEQAQDQLTEEPEEALRLAQTVLNMAQLEPATRRAADAIARRARPRVSGGARDRAVTPPRDREPRDPRGTAGAVTGRDSGTTTSAAVTPPPPADSGQTPLAAARACLARGDNQCAVRALEGRSRTTDEYRLLVETYRAMGNTGRMLDTMERYIQRFPSDPRTQQYRQILLQHGR
ncbi:FHA domain-containing protein [Sandaracinus amylolyticus]|uniref:FHA-domain-containing protein n=1 Tax=Sandaracinus amylolyticus TaxID=927083 RepID=A0A0F6W5W6_9BACT|nr:FHA domain-containing protein [Sandaracinus amylolyticus]AKF08230.1 FHA-domain-containing protein [Sandaracinus amylolyticus]